MAASSSGHRIYVSSSGFMWGTQPVTTYDSGCLRSIVWKGANRDIRGNILPEYAKVGAVHEMGHDQRLACEGVAFHRELPMAVDIPTGEGPTVSYTGRCDFILPGSIDETKATFAKSAPTYILKKRAWKVSHLAQLVGYLWQQEFRKGRIVVGVYEFLPQNIFTGTEYRHIGTVYFEVEIKDDGQIFVDKKSTPYYVQDQLKHIHEAARALEQKKVWPVRPYGWENKWGSPCSYCPFKNLCDRYEAGSVSESETFQEARSILKGDSK